MRYRKFKDDVRAAGITLPSCNYHIIFVLPMPASWSEKKKREMIMQAHQTRPDKDNLEKALLDAIFEEDSHVWDGRVTKIWGTEGCIKINAKTT